MVGVPLLASEPAEDHVKLPDGRRTLLNGCALLGSVGLVTAAALSVSGLCSHKHPIVFGHSVLAFFLGLRHAVDCDHLASIDNVTRRLVNRGQLPVTVGFWFAIGHSSVVIALTMVVACGYSWAWHARAPWTVGVSVVASSLSICLLAGIGLLNARVAVTLFHEWGWMHRQPTSAQHEADQATQQSSLRTAFSFMPFLSRVFDSVDRPVKMCLVGLLFGLSFDTATQVALISLAAMSTSTGGVPAAVAMVIPLCFSCGMCFVDTANGLLMLLAYTWALVSPGQKLFYNFLVTATSATVALLIGSLEFLQLVGREAGFKHGLWHAIQSVNMTEMGFGIIIVFTAMLGVSVLLRLRRRCCQCGFAVAAEM